MEVSVSEGMASRSLTSAGGVSSRGAGAVVLFPHPQLVRKRERAIGIESEMRGKKGGEHWSFILESGGSV